MTAKNTTTSAPPTLLIVEDDVRLRRSLARLVAPQGWTVIEAGSVAEAFEALGGHPDAILLDVRLPDGSGTRVAERAHVLQPAPHLVVLSGAASAAEAFELARLGAVAYLEKPLDGHLLLAELGRAHDRLERVRHAIAGAVGLIPLPEAERLTRRVMTTEALSRTDGNRTHAAELLGVTRQVVQHLAREIEKPEDEGD